MHADLIDDKMVLDENVAKPSSKTTFADKTAAGTYYSRNHRTYNSREKQTTRGFDRRDGRDNRDNRSAPYQRRPNPDEPWRHDRYKGPVSDLRQKIGPAQPAAVSDDRASSSRPSGNNVNGGIASRLGAVKPGVASSNFIKRSVGDVLLGSGVGSIVQMQIQPAQQQGGVLVRVHNLDPKASAADVQATFSEFGVILKSSVSIDAVSSTGTADILFKESSSAKSAIETFNGLVADGRTLKLEEVVINTPRSLQITGRGTGSIKPATVPVLKTSGGAVVIGGMYSDRLEANRATESVERKTPITERLGGRFVR